MLDVYYKPGCPFCKSAVEIMKQNKLKHNIHMLNTETKREQIKKTHNFYTFPQIFYNKKFIGGSDDFIKLIQICKKLDNVICDVNDDVLNIVSGLCVELSTNKQKIKKLLTKKK